MPRLTDDEVEQFLARPLTCRLGYLDETGAPRVVPCLYHFEDGVFYLSARGRSRWGELLERDGRASLCIDASDFDEEEYNKRVLVQGEAELIYGPAALYRDRDHPLAQLGLRECRRYGWAATDEEIWQQLEEIDDVGWRIFRVAPVAMTSWWGPYASRYRNAFPAPT